MRVCFKIMLLALVLTTTCGLPASRPQAARDVSRIDSAITDAESNLDVSLGVLKGKDAKEWRDAEVETYLHDALFLVYLGAVRRTKLDSRFPSNIKDILSSGDISTWPGNPLNEWKPMEVREVASGFSAGDLVLQVCPPDYWSVMTDPRPCSFVLGIYAPRQGYFKLVNASVGANKWASAPDDVLLLLNYFRATASSQREKFEAAKAAEKASADANADPSNSDGH